jgi:IclR family acetate operon transcriptional repressor
LASEVAHEFGIDRSTALRLLRELESTGYVARDPTSKRYTTVGARFYRLIANTEDHSDLSELVDPILLAVRDEFGEAAVFAVPSREQMVYVASFASHQILAVHEPLGAMRPMHCSAVGKAYLSGLDGRALTEVVDRLTFQGGTRYAAHDGVSLVARIDVAREIGYAVDRDETSLGVSCVAAALWVGGALVGAVGVTGPTTRLPDELAARIGIWLRAAAAELRGPRSNRLSGQAAESQRFVDPQAMTSSRTVTP